MDMWSESRYRFFLASKSEVADLLPRLARAIPLLPLLRERIALPDRRGRLDCCRTRERNLEEIQNRAERCFIILTKRLVLDTEGFETDAGKESGPDALLLFEFFETVSDQRPIELWLRDRCVALLHFPKTGLDRAGLGEGLEQLFAARDLDKAQTRERIKQHFQI